MKLIYLSSIIVNLNYYICLSLNYDILDNVNWENFNLFEQISDNFRIGTKVEFRTLNGVGNNIEHPLYGSKSSESVRCLPPAYEDGISSLAGPTRMNPREISNVISKEIPEESDFFVNRRHLTQFAWQWGQFIDHDMDLLSEDRSMYDLLNEIDILVPCSDPQFDQQSTCDADLFISVFRTRSFPGTGTSKSNPRNQVNDVTSFIDGSMVYGSDLDRAMALRTGQNGLLLETEDGLLPKNFNTAPIQNAPNLEAQFFIGGDIRVNEVIGLTVMHTILVRAHNILAQYVGESLISSGLYSMNDYVKYDEAVYQFTKLIINAIIQKITYKDWLPSLFGDDVIEQFLGEYAGYDDDINAGICTTFASASFRFHSLLPQSLPLRNEDCSYWTDFDLSDCPICKNSRIELRDTFFVPQIIDNTDGFIEALLNGYVCTLGNEQDIFVTSGVRNFLFESALNANGERIFGILDLIAINLQRGRDHGLPDYNSVRFALGLNRLSSFNELSSDTEINRQFKEIYNDNINDIDLFIGGLAEDHLSGSSFGPIISGVVLEQFGRLRDGDRFYYENYIKRGPLLHFIKSVTLRDIIELTTNIDNIGSLDPITQRNVFQNDDAVSIFAPNRNGQKRY